MKKTAVEWLIDALSHKDEAGKICINIHPDCDITPEIKRAKQMEKEQIKDAYESGVWDLGCRNSDSKKYYNETYGNK
jgi:hypothetical protein